MRPIIVFLAASALVSPTPSPAPLAPLATELAAKLQLAHDCNRLAMDKPNADRLAYFLDDHRAPVVEIAYCNGKPDKLRNQRHIQGWAETHCRMPGQPEDPSPPPGAVTCGGRCCDVERSVRVCFDEKNRIRRIEYRCTAAK